MRRIIIIWALAALSGCTSTYIKTPAYEISRISFLQKVSFTATSTTNGLRIDYGNDGGQEAAGKIAGAAAAVITK
jgi:hypothetical protein